LLEIDINRDHTRQGIAMVIREMSEQECYAMLAETRIARLACARENQPYIVPLHVDFKGGALYSYATLGQKIEWMRHNPLVCIEMDDFRNDDQWASLVVDGFYEELPNTFGYEGSRAIAQGLFQRHVAWWQPASVPVGAHGVRAPIVFRIHITRVSGRRATPDQNPINGLRDTPGSSRAGWLARVLSRLTR
jgi:uncharacterized protein